MDNAERERQFELKNDRFESGFSASKFCGRKNSEPISKLSFTQTGIGSEVALIGPTAVQIGTGILDSASSTEMRQLVCSLFVDSIVASIPKSRRKRAQKELADLMQRLNIVPYDYFSEAFSSARRPLSLLISKFVVQACQQASSVSLSPNVDFAISINGLSLVNSRYLSDFEEISRIGVGGFGKVYKVRSLVDNQLYAIKQIRFDGSSSESFAKILSECRYHASLQNEHVVRYHNAWVEFESMDTGSLKSRRSLANNALSNSQNSTEGRVCECSISPTSTTTLSSIKSKSLRSTNASLKLGKFWKARRPTAKSSSSSTDDEFTNEKTEKTTDSSVSVKFQYDNERIEEHNADDVEEEIQFINGSEFNAQSDAIVPWSTTTQSQSMETRQISQLLKPTSSIALSKSRPNDRTDNDSNIDLGIPVLYIQMELCASTLERYLAERKVLNMEFNEATVFGLLSAIDFLHKNQLIHRDVKPSNVLLKRRNGRLCALLGDFGLTREVARFVHVNNTDDKHIKRTGDVCRVNTPMVHDACKLTDGIGTALYAAPEQIASQDYGPMVDVYSAGIVFYELFQIFNTSMERVVSLTSLRETSRPVDRFRLMWPEICTLIERMIPVEPNCRWTAGQILSHLQTRHGHVIAPPEDRFRREHGFLNVKSSPDLLQSDCSNSISANEVTNDSNNLSLDLSNVHSLCNEEIEQLKRKNTELEAQIVKLQEELTAKRRSDNFKN